MITASELKAAIRKAGNVSVPVLTANGVEHIRVVKSDLLHNMDWLDGDMKAPWCVILEDSDGITLDVQD